MQDPGAGFTFFPLIARLVELFTDMHVAQFFCLKGFVCPCLFPRARFFHFGMSTLQVIFRFLYKLEELFVLIWLSIRRMTFC